MFTIIDNSNADTRVKMIGRALNPVQRVLPAELIERLCRNVGFRWRDRLWGPAITVLGCVWKHLHQASCREVEDWHAGLSATALQSARDGKGFCDARRRVPESVFAHSLRHVGAAAVEKGAQIYKGLKVMLVDGTTFRAPLTARNSAHFGRSINQTGESGFPLVRVVLMVCAGCAAIVDAAIGSYRGTAEMRLFREILERLCADRLIIGDRAFGSYLSLWKISERGSHALIRHHRTRRGALIKKLGKNDELHLWKKPQKWQVAWHDWLAVCPDQIQVRVIRKTIRRRGYRPWELVLCTTLLDPNVHRADDLVELYLQRWDIEVDLRSLKSEYLLDRLSGKTPDVVIREIYSGMLAHTLVRNAMAETGASVRALSHDRAKIIFLQTCAQMSAASTLHLPTLYCEMLSLMRSATLCKQQRLPQPRSLVPRPRKYPDLQTTRSQWRERYLAVS